MGAKLEFGLVSVGGVDVEEVVPEGPVLGCWLAEADPSITRVSTGRGFVSSRDDILGGRIRAGLLDRRREDYGQSKAGSDMSTRQLPRHDLYHSSQV